MISLCLSTGLYHSMFSSNFNPHFPESCEYVDMSGNQIQQVVSDLLHFQHVSYLLESWEVSS